MRYIRGALATLTLATVLIPSIGRVEPLKCLLKCLEVQSDKDFEVIVVAQNQGELPADLGVNLSMRVISLPTPVGSPRARNLAIGEARGDCVISCDDDIIVGQRWVESFKKAFSELEDVGMVAGRVLAASPGIYYAHDLLTVTKRNLRLEEKNAWNASPQVQDSNPNGFNRWTGTFGKNFHVSFRHYADHAYGCNMAVRHELLRSLGGFDEVYTFKGQFEEADLALRIRAADWKILFEPRAIAFHSQAPFGGHRTSKSGYVDVFRGRYRSHAKVFKRHGRLLGMPIFMLARMSETTRWAFHEKEIRLISEAGKGLWDGLVRD